MAIAVKGAVSMTLENGPIETQVAAYIASSLQQDVPDVVLERARCHLLDTLTAILSGRFLPAGEFGYAFAAAANSGNEATFLGSTWRGSLEYAAFANAMAAHADETDDSHIRGRLHPGCAMVPAAIAVAERENAGSEALLKAIALGYDIGARANIALGYSSPRTTIFSTHSIGALFGASAAAAALMGLTTKQAEALLSFTVQQTSRLSYWNRDPDHVEKSFDFGAKAARNGVFAALLAKAGMTAPDRPLTGERAYLAAYAENPKPDELCAGLGDRFEILAASIKKWSVGSPIQSVLDAIEVLFGGEPVDPATIDSIEVRLPSNRIHVVDDRHMPAICTQHLVAIALIDGRVTFASSHDEARMQANDVLALRQKVRLVPDDGLTDARPERQSIVTIQMSNGDVKRHHTRVVRGTPDDPMPASEVAGKAEDILGPIQADRGQGLIDLCLYSDFEIADLVDACRIDIEARRSYG
ncbi:MAG: MmgE/PrpD family protein [Roseibium sp.]|uniref:MmgE/PrpD family protein n=1 Tax=Roseibium sp. TaxID=1936156 RepID=UPI001B008E52|nr:MmgE/PrpD family protein [Roseibium sp.]MBO6892621.1 MmgE/PrpD family protein [Roseibium sp.]MBO6928249.1 MmgE/PrpD family protein [Roseibium sp.]